jgi:hypothetical protein
VYAQQCVEPSGTNGRGLDLAHASSTCLDATDARASADQSVGARHRSMLPPSDDSAASSGRQLKMIPVTLAERSHPFPSRTRKLSSPAPKILGGQLPGKIGRRRDFHDSAAIPTRGDARIGHGYVAILSRWIGSARSSHSETTSAPSSTDSIRRIAAARRLTPRTLPHSIARLSSSFACAAPTLSARASRIGARLMTSSRGESPQTPASSARG